jgi:hypothetical protein
MPALLPYSYLSGRLAAIGWTDALGLLATPTIGASPIIAVRVARGPLEGG